MLPAAARLRAAADFTAAARRGRRGSSPTVVVHLLRTDREAGPRAGFVVSKKVGNSVVRHRVTRRLRPLVRTHLQDLPDGTDLVVRALPAAADASSTRLSTDLTSALRGAARRAGIDLVTVGLVTAALLPQTHVAARRPSPLAWLLIAPIRFYQRFITPYTPATCRYYPTCSSYAVRALRTHGAVKGTLLTAARLLRCNPWSSGGIDYPPPRGRWRGVPTDPDRPADSDSGSDSGSDTGSPTTAGTASGLEPADPAPTAERSGPLGRSATDLSCTAQPAPARAPIAGSTAA